VAVAAVTAVSVIIATRDRAGKLAAALESLERSIVPATLSWEVIVVDNGSTDETHAVVREAQLRGRAPMHYVLEPRPGKSISLNTGLRHAAGRALAFTDDDCVVDRQWIAAIAREFEADTSLAALGGRVELHDARDYPVTVRTQTARREFSAADLTLIVGCNMAISREALSAAGPFDPTLGPGSQCYAAEDFDLLYRIHRAGRRIMYVPAVLVHHDHGRRTDAEVRRLYRGYGVSLGAFYGKHILRGDVRIAWTAAQQVVWIAVDVVRNVAARRRPPNRVRLRDLITGAAVQMRHRSKIARPTEKSPSFTGY
jgi:glycosyltransferase involved in cell wall biosynthesis